jgi:hypothetical protein
MKKAVNLQLRTEWEGKIRTQQMSGLSIAKWCKDNQVVQHTFYYWKDRLFPKEKRLSFAELKSDKGTGVSIEYNNLRICLESDFDPLVLKRCMLALREEAQC